MLPHLLLTDEIDAATLLDVLLGFGCIVLAERDGSLSVTPPEQTTLPPYFAVLIQLRMDDILRLMNDDSGCWSL